MNRQQYLAHLQKAIKATHGCDSKHVEQVPVRETYQGKTVWEGNVEVFDLIGHAKTKRCYAWAYDVEDGSRTLAVLELPPVISPITAVRAAIAAGRPTGGATE
jgi:hypothetical protein